jgi:hypothetical protein
VICVIGKMLKNWRARQSRRRFRHEGVTLNAQLQQLLEMATRFGVRSIEVAAVCHYQVMCINSNGSNETDRLQNLLMDLRQ